MPSFSFSKTGTSFTMPRGIWTLKPTLRGCRGRVTEGEPVNFDRERWTNLSTEKQSWHRNSLGRANALKGPQSLSESRLYMFYAGAYNAGLNKSELL